MSLLRIEVNEPLLYFTTLCICVRDTGLWIHRVACYIYHWYGLASWPPSSQCYCLKGNGRLFILGIKLRLSRQPDSAFNCGVTNLYIFEIARHGDDYRGGRITPRTLPLLRGWDVLGITIGWFVRTLYKFQRWNRGPIISQYSLAVSCWYWHSTDAAILSPQE